MTDYPQSRIRSCDTLVVAPAASRSGRTLFGKNSDRHPNEAQYPTVVAAATHPAGEEVRCTFVSIPQVEHTYRVLGSRPWWLWGFEHGINEYGVVIGNEALWSRIPARREPGLIGMDILRLTLERARTADEALTVLTGLIETHGQSGPTNTVIDETYDNGFVIADPTTAWLVQSADRHWAAKRVETVGSMSNIYTIGSEYTLLSSDAIAYATDAGWYDPAGGEPFDFAAAYGDPQLPGLDGCRDRFVRSDTLLAELHADGAGIDLEQVHAVLCDLGDGPVEALRPGPRSEHAICMYAQDTKGSETAAAMIAELDPRPDHVRIGIQASSPRHSTLIPVWADIDDVPGWQQPDREAESDDDYWWRTERLQRRIEAAYPALSPVADALFARLNRRFFDEGSALSGASPDERRAATERGIERHLAAIEGLHTLFDRIEPVVVTEADADLRGAYLSEIEEIAVRTTADRIERTRAALIGSPSASV